MPLNTVGKEYYFTLPSPTKGHHSPFAIFDSEADSSDTWKSHTNPGNFFQPKTLIFTQESSEEFSIGDLVGVLHHLQRHGFRCVIQLDQEWIFCEGIDFLLSTEKRMSIPPFNPEQDYEAITDQLKIPRNQLLRLEKKTIRQLFFHLNAKKWISEKEGNGSDFQYSTPIYPGDNNLLKVILHVFNGGDLKIHDHITLFQRVFLGDELAIYSIGDLLLQMKSESILKGEDPDNVPNWTVKIIIDLMQYYYRYLETKAYNVDIVSRLIYFLMRYESFLPALSETNVLFMAKINPLDFANYLDENPTAIQKYTSSCKAKLALIDECIAERMLDHIVNDPTTQQSFLESLIKKYAFFFIKMIENGSILQKLLDNNTIDTMLKKAIEYYLTYKNEPDKALADRQLLEAAKKNSYIASVIYFYHPDLKKEYERTESPSTWLECSAITKNIIFTIKEYDINERRTILCKLFSEKNRSFLFENPSSLRLLIQDSELIKLIDKNLFFDFILCYQFTSLGQGTIVSELIDCSFMLYGDEGIQSIFAKSRQTETGAEILERLLREGCFECDASSEHSIIHFLALLQQPEMRIYFTPTILIQLACLDFLLAKIILQDNEYRSRLSANFGLPKIIMRFPSLYPLCQKEIEIAGYTLSTTHIQIIRPSILKIDSERFYADSLEKESPAVPSWVELDHVVTIQFPKMDFTKIVHFIEKYKSFFPSLRTILVVCQYAHEKRIRTFLEKSLPDISVLSTLQKIHDKRAQYHYPDEEKRRLQSLPRLDVCTEVKTEDTHPEYGIWNAQKPVTYLMEKRAVLLNVEYQFWSGYLEYSRNRPSIRTQVCDFNYQESTNTVEYRSIPATNYTAVETIFTPRNCLWNYCEQDDNEEFYYFLFTQSLPKDTLTLLFSIYQGQFVAVIGEHSCVDIQKGNDGFYYARPLSEITLEYIIKLPRDYSRRNSMLYESIPKIHPIRAIIDSYLDPLLGFTETADKHPIIPTLSPDIGFDQWRKELFKQRAGICSHRVMAVQYALIEAGYGDFVRAVIVNNIHIVLEILVNGVWCVVDCGGADESSSTLINKTPSNPDKSEFVPTPVAPETIPEIPDKKTLLINGTSPALCESIEALFSFSHHRKITVRAEDVNSAANALLKKCSENVCPFFYIDSKEYITVKKEQLFITPDKKPIITTKTALDDYLDKVRKNPGIRHILIIDIQQATLPVDICIPDNVCVISLSTHFPDNADFIADQNVIVELRCTVEPPLMHYSERQDAYNLRGCSDWKKALFGRITLDNNTMHWKESDFLSFSQFQDNVIIHLINFPERMRDEIHYFLAQSKAKGYFEYYGYHISIPNPVNIICGIHNYDFSTVFCIDSVAYNVTAEYASRDQHLVNTHSFDLLMHDKYVNDGVYFDRPGLLERYANTTLSLVITTPLTEEQWYCLLLTAQDYCVTLQLQLAPGVNMPSRCFFPSVSQDFSHTASRDVKSHCIITNDANAILKEMISEHPASTVVDAKNCSFQTVGYSIHYEKTAEGFSHFQLQVSDLLTALMNGETVILTGEFDVAFLLHLDTLLLPNDPYVWINGEKRYFPGKLQLVVEDLAFTPSTPSIYQQIMQWTSPNGYTSSSGYIYHQLVEPIIHTADLDIPKKTLQADCFLFIAAYQRRNGDADRTKHMSVHELQRAILSYCMKNNHRYFYRALLSKRGLFKTPLVRDQQQLSEEAAYERCASSP